MSKIAGIYWDDTAAAPGISLSVYFSGCHFHCPGCHNPEAQDFDYGVNFDKRILRQINLKLNKNGVQRTLSILGGEPLCPENREAVVTLIDFCKKENPNLKIYLWTGYTIEELQAMGDENINYILNNINCLIDGPFILEQRDITLPLRGSTNQRIINMEKKI